jgi:hypothetical protein
MGILFLSTLLELHCAQSEIGVKHPKTVYRLAGLSIPAPQSMQMSRSTDNSTESSGIFPRLQEPQPFL